MSENTINVKIKQRYDTEANWQTANPILLEGELAISSDKGGAYKIGDGTSTWSALSYNTADMANKLTVNAGSATQPIYFSNGIPVKTTYTLGKSVPSDAVFTDTNTWIALKGATTSAAGTAGYAPAPSAGDANRYLRCDGTWTIPPDTNTTYSAATTSTPGLMSAADKAKLDGIATSANNYTLPEASSSLGGVKTTSTVTSTSGLTACPIISGVPYYKDTTYTSLKNPNALTIQGNGTTLTNGTYDGSAAKTVNITPSSIGAAESSHGTHVTFSTTAPKAAGTAAVGTATTVSRSDHVHPLQTTVTGNAGTATKWATARNINGMSVQGDADRVNYGTCSTAAATAAKTVACTGFALVTGAEITVKFTYANTNAAPTLNVNSTGAKSIYYKGASIGSGKIAANGTYTFRYNGTQYDLVGDVEDTSKDYLELSCLSITANHGYICMNVNETNFTPGQYSCGFGYVPKATGNYSFTAGNNPTASGNYSASIGNSCTASGQASFAVGQSTSSTQLCSSAMGYGLSNTGQLATIIGKYNSSITGCSGPASSTGDAFAIGSGTSSTVKSNAFRVTFKGEVYGKSSFNSSGADYAEFIYEWADGNENNEDRVGYFVTFKDQKLVKAKSNEYILGITSGNPSVIGNADEDYYWMYERDEFNRLIMTDVPETISEVDEDGNTVFIETGNVIKNGALKISEDWDSTLQDSYIERKDRPEWDYVGMLGVIPVRDDGTCVPGQYCKCNDNGEATLATVEDARDNRFTYMVLERTNDHVVKVVVK